MKEFFKNSDFNRGLAERIFAEVKSNGPKVVIIDNNPEAILLSPISQLLEDIEDALE